MCLEILISEKESEPPNSTYLAKWCDVSVQRRKIQKYGQHNDDNKMVYSGHSLKTLQVIAVIIMAKQNQQSTLTVYNVFG